MSVSVILLAHNEADTIQGEIRAFHDAIVTRLQGAELIVAEDGSRDGTREQILELSRRLPLRVVGGPERLGYARAVIGAVAEATQPWLFLCDAGLKHDPNDFWRFWERRHEYDYLAGRKTNREDQLHRRLFTWGYNLLIRQLFSGEIFDSDSGMRLMSRRVAERIVPAITFKDLSSSEIVIRTIAAGFRYGEVPIAYRQRTGESRGLPAARIPTVILAAIRNLVRLRRELR